ncbi:hypothetical protein [Streptomyces sp. NPDC050263]|uniref:hypothetical protein n=1 Tax=Streptomyces sp. NPDC050263 TaxID=3155037 RepID=UPI003417F00A
MTEPWSVLTVTTAVVLVLLAAVLRTALHLISPRTTVGLCAGACLLIAAWTFQLELWPWDVLSAALTLLVLFAWAPGPDRTPPDADASTRES